LITGPPDRDPVPIEVVGSTPAQLAADCRRQLDRISEAGAVRLILQKPPGVKPEASGGRVATLPAFVDEVRRIADERGLLLVDHFAHWQAAGDDAEPWYADPFHPNAAGHAEMARLLCHTLQAPVPT
jgi:lysophospholipase L1-like esterase